MSTSTTSSNRFSLVENWDTETLIIFLRDLDINLDDDDFKILPSQEILEVVRDLLLKKKVNGKKGCKPLADTSNLQEEVVKKPVPPKSDLLISSVPVVKK
ncbi:9142_t:CDS:2 [Funneliformis caledonium]|uniref:9142_t:CDS:1 n=1 Tax=Funneliformis caledonium TaxID=1117310 RepID=A0A9N9FFQ4_9GLOM|nr:9142_t:CDS:2 [Funneliformis caledonium]